MHQVVMVYEISTSAPIEATLPLRFLAIYPCGVEHIIAAEMTASVSLLRRSHSG